MRWRRRRAAGRSWPPQEDDALVALIVRPDGTSARAVVDRAELIGDVYAGIDAAGRVTIAWWRYERRRSALLMARFSAGEAPVAAEVPGSEQSSVAAVAVAPGGGSLIAWATEGGVSVMLDGGAPVALDTASTDVAALSASLSDDGTALVGYLRRREELVDRLAIGRGVAGSARALVGRGAARSVRQRPVAAGAHDARAGRSRCRRVGGGGGRRVEGLRRPQPGGAWAPATRLSSITRAAYVTSLAPDAAGVPLVLWAESELGVRGATLAPARADVTAPVVTTRFPARVPRTRDARVTLAVRVRCSEACDARLTIPAPDDTNLFDIDVFGDVVQALDPGRTTTLRVRLRSDIAHELVRNPRARRLRMRLVVTDRAGNLVRRGATVRVPVIDKRSDRSRSRPTATSV